MPHPLNNTFNNSVKISAVIVLANPMQKTFIAIKPDGVQRKLIGRIITRFEDIGFTLIEMKLMYVSPELAKQHYAEHVSKAFFPELVDFITSGPIVAMVWKGDQIVDIVRKMVGETNSAEASPGTIRGDFSSSLGRNIIHASDSAESASRETKLFFPELDI